MEGRGAHFKISAILPSLQCPPLTLWSLFAFPSFLPRARSLVSSLERRGAPLSTSNKSGFETKGIERGGKGSLNHASHSIRRLRVVSAVQLHCSLPGGPVKGIIPISREVCVVGRVCALCKQAPPEPSTRYAYGGREEGRKERRGGLQCAACSHKKAQTPDTLRPSSRPRP